MRVLASVAQAKPRLRGSGWLEWQEARAADELALPSAAPALVRQVRGFGRRANPRLPRSASQALREAAGTTRPAIRFAAPASMSQIRALLSKPIPSSRARRGWRCGKLLWRVGLPSSFRRRLTRVLRRRQSQCPVRLKDLLEEPKPDQIRVDLAVPGLVLVLLDILGEPRGGKSADGLSIMRHRRSHRAQLLTGGFPHRDFPAARFQIRGEFDRRSTACRRRSGARSNGANRLPHS